MRRISLHCDWKNTAMEAIWPYTPTFPILNQKLTSHTQIRCCALCLPNLSVEIGKEAYSALLSISSDLSLALSVKSLLKGQVCPGERGRVRKKSSICLSCVLVRMHLSRLRLTDRKHKQFDLGNEQSSFISPDVLM